MKRSLFMIVVATVALLAGCDRKDSGSPPSGTQELMLYCGAGIRPPADDLIGAFFAEYGIRVVPDYAGSEVLLSKMKLTGRGDLYMPGDKHYVDQADAADMILSRRTVCYWVPTILVQKGNPKGIGSLQDLLKPGVKVGFGDPNACAIGRSTVQILAKNGIKWEQISENVRFQSLTVNELGMQIQARSLDAVVVWDAMARYYSRYGDQIPIPLEKNVVSTVDAGILKFTRNKEAAEKFVAFLVCEKGREIFAKHNYSTEPPK
jgi:molybdate transport system substrate-binding protein